MSKEMRGLIIYDRQPTSAGTLVDHVGGLHGSRLVDFETKACRGDLPDDLRLEQYDVLVLHYSWSPVVMQLSSETLQRIRRFEGIKIWILQDEYRRVNRANELASFLEISGIITVFPTHQAEVIYEPSLRSGIRVATVLTGYLPLDSEGLIRPDFYDRHLDVSYRGRELPRYYGEVAQQKAQIGIAATEVCRSLGLTFDIETAEDKRLYGDDWTNLLLASKAVLGVESMVSRIDFTGHQEVFGRNRLVTRPREIPSNFWKDPLVFGEAGVRVISPRIFEYIVTGCLMILAEGDYSGVLTPEMHYLPVKSDFSNLREQIVRSQDVATWERITKQAFDDIVKSGSYTYAELANEFDALLSNILLADGKTFSKRASHSMVDSTGLDFFKYREVSFTSEVVPKPDFYEHPLNTSRVIWRIRVIVKAMDRILHLNLGGTGLLTRSLGRVYFWTLTHSWSYKQLWPRLKFLYRLTLQSGFYRPKFMKLLLWNHNANSALKALAPMGTDSVLRSTVQGDFVIFEVLPEYRCIFPFRYGPFIDGKAFYRFPNSRMAQRWQNYAAQNM